MPFIIGTNQYGHSTNVFFIFKVFKTEMIPLNHLNFYHCMITFQLVIVSKSIMHDCLKHNGRYFKFYIEVYYDAFVGSAVTLRYFILKT